MTHVLLPVAVLEGETVGPGVIELLSPVTVTVLGYHEVPEQTPPDQARLQFEERANEILDDICDAFEATGARAYRRLVFTHDRGASIDRIAAEVEADATLVLQPTPHVEEVYVAVGAGEEVERLCAVLGEIVGGLEADVFLRYFLGAEGSDDPAAAEGTLTELADGLVDAGVDRERIDTAVQDGKKAVGPIVADADGRGVDIVAFSDPGFSLGEFVFGDVDERVASQLLAPVLVVRNRQSQQQE